VSVSSMCIMKIERELRLLPLSPADRDVAHPSFFRRANTLPSPSCPNRWLHTNAAGSTQTQGQECKVVVWMELSLLTEPGAPNGAGP